MTSGDPLERKMRRKVSAKAKSKARAPRATTRSSPGPWEQLKDPELLEWPLQKLGLRPDQGALGKRVDELMTELERVEIRLRPRVWLSTDWFSPDGIPGIALPFYLAHPRLVRLERAQVLMAEGSSVATCRALLRHEAGHAVDTAYRLSRRAVYRKTFGKRSQPYRRHYTVDPTSQDFVQHLDRWYAQSHPAEDFAESFAVWLQARGRCPVQYRGTPAEGKLEVVDTLMESIRAERPSLTSRQTYESVGSLSLTLDQHYRSRRRRMMREAAPPFDSALGAHFLPGRPWSRNASAAGVLGRRRKSIARLAVGELGIDDYTAQQIVEWMLQRCRELGLTASSDLEPYAAGPFLPMIRDCLRALARGDARISR